tara:strand:- start:684 stop:1193 length:510 start_codon:yes stop_codon:yes gene_type:complete
MRYSTQSGQHPDQVVAACRRQVRRAIARPATRIAVLAALRPYTRGIGHTDLNGDQIAESIQRMVQAITFYREPAGEGLPGEVIQSPTLTLELNGGDCDDIAVLAATAAAVLGCKAAIGWYSTSSDGSQAHIVAGVQPGWYQSGQWVIIDAQKEKPTHPESLTGARWLRV